MRGATFVLLCLLCEGLISIHAPHAGRDWVNPETMEESMVFQSTRPMRGATSWLAEPWEDTKLFQSTRPMRGATSQENHDGNHSGISIHAPHAGRDLDVTASKPKHQDFNPRAPCGARPADIDVTEGGLDISIHAPHAGRDYL